MTLHNAISPRPDDRFEIDGFRLRFMSTLGDVLFFLDERTLSPFKITAPETGEEKPPTLGWLLQQMADGKVVKVGDRRGPTPRQVMQIREYDGEDIEKLDARAKLRLFVVNELDKLGNVKRGDKAINAALAKIWAENPKAADFATKPSPTAVRRWLDERGIPDERLLKQMISASGRVPRARKLDPVMVEMLHRFAMYYWTKPTASIIDAYAKLYKLAAYINTRRKRAGNVRPALKIASRETLRTDINHLECYETYKAKWGEAKAKAKFKSNGPALTAPCARMLGLMDHTMLDGIAVIDADWMLPIGRPWLTVLLDVATRCVVGWVLSYEPPSLYSVTECIKRANRPKVHLAQSHPRYPVLPYIFGRFDEIMVDNGWELTGGSFEDAVGDAGMSIRWAPVRTPTHKAIVERFFGILNHLLNRKLPGGTLKPDLMREMGYDPSKDAVLTIEELEELIWEALAFYHVDLHTGINAAPAARWEADMKRNGIDVIADERQLDKAAGAMKYPCKLTKTGITLFGLSYFERTAVGNLLDDLVGLEPKRHQRRGSATATVKVKYNPANLGEIHVWNRRRKVYATLPCTDEKYASGVSLWHHERLREFATRANLEFNTEEDRLLARAHLIERIEEKGGDMKMRQRRAMARLRHQPKVEELAGDTVRLAMAPSRHDGLAPIIVEHAMGASSRQDDGAPAKKPPRGGVQRRAASRAQPARLEYRTGDAAGFAVTIDDVGQDAASWSEFA